MSAKHLWMECPACGLKYRNEEFDQLVAALSTAVTSLSYAVDVLQAPSKSAIREDLASMKLTLDRVQS